MKFPDKNLKLSIIDVGTNNILLLLVEKQRDKFEIVESKSSTSALGKNMKDRTLTQSAIRRTKNILGDFISYSRFFTDNIIVIGTSCSRDANNIEQISSWLWKKYKLRYLIISGNDEAYLNGLANIDEFPHLKEFILFDIGGGSTEFTYIENRQIKRFLSLNLGIRRLQNSFGSNTLDKESQTRKLLQELPCQKKNLPLVGIGGTVTSLAVVKHELKDYDSKIVHRTLISATELSLLYRKIIRLNNKQLVRLIPFDPASSHIIATGTMIVNEILSYFNAEEFYISDKGFQFGILKLNNTELLELEERSHEFAERKNERF
jgi:exopolyphosphatase / guanosine-5'-triphosphate,3'-diphosphate pyrophosphatase